MEGYTLTGANCDGFDDILAFEFVSTSVKYLLNDGTGQFIRAETLKSSGTDSNLRLAFEFDFDGRGGMDLLTLTTSSNSPIEFHINKACPSS